MDIEALVKQKLQAEDSEYGGRRVARSRALAVSFCGFEQITDIGQFLDAVEDVAQEAKT